MWISLDGETTGTRKTPSSSSSSSSEPPRGGTFLHTRLWGSSEGKRQRGINVLVPWTLLYKDPVWERQAHDQRAWTFSGRGRQRPPGYTAAYHCAVLSGFGHRALITPLNAATFNHLCGLVMNIWGCRSWDLVSENKLQWTQIKSTYSKNHLLYPDRRLYAAIPASASCIF